MAKISKKKRCYKSFRILLIFLFVAGFTYQTLQFLFLYWTYPTVVDIQQSSPSYLDIPSFTFCNRIGYRYNNICTEFKMKPCANAMFTKVVSSVICKQFPVNCLNGSLPKDFKTIFFGKFMYQSNVTREEFDKLAVRLEEYLKCTIEFAGKVRNCNLENVLGSFYTPDELPQFCYTIYSKWGNPDKQIDKIPKGATMKFHLFLNASQRLKEQVDSPEWFGPKYVLPTEPQVQIAVHSPYFLPSPYFEGYSFLAGRSYEMRIKVSESHLLPLPYQTNCTDYITPWRERGGKGPINQLGIIQECRVNVTYEKLGCIPSNIDYPHEYDICKTCEIDKNCVFEEPPNDCAMMADNYNQPCDSMNYDVEKENKVITIFEKIDNPFAQESDGFRMSMAEYDCEGSRAWKRECSTITIQVPFDRYEITNITYNPKFESLELFSVVGGYMGMWLGISLLAIFDMFSSTVSEILSYIAKKKKKGLRVKKTKFPTSQQYFRSTKNYVNPTLYNKW